MGTIKLGFTPTVINLIVLPNAIIWRYLCNDCRLLTQCGQPDKTALQANGQEGFLIYGPYVQLPAGHYVARLSLTAHAALSGAWADVSGAGGTQPFARLDVSLIPDQITEAVMTFELKVNCDDIEVRLWVPKGADLAVQSLVIEAID